MFTKPFHLHLHLPRLPHLPSLHPSTKIHRTLTTLTTLHPPVPKTPKCPPPSCPCAPTPIIPKHPIDEKTNLNNTMPVYDEHVLICTGKDDWMSRIEEENGGENFAADLKGVVGRGGRWFDPYHKITLTNTSFPPSPSPHASQTTPSTSTSAYLFPSFKYIPHLPRTPSTLETLTKSYLLPRKLHPAHDNLSGREREKLLRNTAQEGAGTLPNVQDVQDIIILICSHGGRDARCGVYGPLLKKEFEKALAKQGFSVEEGAVDISRPSKDQELLDHNGQPKTPPKTARVGLISHIGGHKFAGNVILYFPPGMTSQEGGKHPLAGCGIWYGRVEPRSVEGIVGETVRKGVVIEELFRGGLGRGGEVLRI